MVDAIKTFRDNSEHSVKISMDAGISNSNIEWKKTSGKDGQENYLDNFRKNLFFIDSVRDEKVHIKFPFDDYRDKIMESKDFSGHVRELNKSEAYQMLQISEKEVVLAKNKNVVLEHYPDAVVRQLPQDKGFEVYSNNGPEAGKGLSEKGGTSADAWQQAANRVMKEKDPQIGAELGNFREGLLEEQYDSNDYPDGFNPELYGIIEKAPKYDVVDAAATFHIENDYPGKIRNIATYGEKNPLVSAFEKETGFKLSVEDLQKVDTKVEEKQDQNQGMSY